MIYGAVLEGIEAIPVRVYVERDGMFDVEGLSETARRETCVRVRASFAQLGKQPQGIVRVQRNDGLPIQYGANLDLAIAVAASGLLVPCDALFAGELSLNGEIRGIRGVVPIGLLIRNYRVHGVLPRASPLPKSMAPMRGERLCAAHLSEVLDAIACANLPTEGGTGEWILPLQSAHSLVEVAEIPQWAEIEGNAVEIPFAHEVLAAVEKGVRALVLVGEPGSGRTRVPRRIASLLPALTDDERLEIDTITSAAGLPTHGVRPFRAPHPTASTAAVIGGTHTAVWGTPIRPGEVTLAHNGVLLLDEAHEVAKVTMDALITTLKKGEITAARMAASTAGGVHTVRMPARPAVVVFTITMPSPRDTSSRKDAPIAASEKASIDALTKRYQALVDRLVKELDAVVIDCPRAKGGA